MTNNIWKESPQQIDMPSSKEYIDAIRNLPALVCRVTALEQQIKELKTKGV